LQGSGSPASGFSMKAGLPLPSGNAAGTQAAANALKVLFACFFFQEKPGQEKAG